MQTIPGLTEAQILKVIDSVINQLAPLYVFGYYTLSDIKQEGWIFGLEALDKFDPYKGKVSKDRNSLSDRLYNFLRSHIMYRYFNLLRDNYERAEPPNCECKHCKNNNKEECPRYQKFLNRNLIKKLIASPAQEQLETSIEYHDNVETKEFFENINNNLSSDLRADFRRLLDGVKIPNSRKMKIKEAIIRIIQHEV